MGISRNSLRNLVGMAACVALAGCALLDPFRPLTDLQLAQRVARHKEIIRAQPAEIAGELTLSGAIARALAYNLDLRMAMLEEVIARGNIDLVDLDKLPHLVLSAGYTRRDRPSGVNTDTRPGQVERTTANSELAWSVIDFGVAYIRSQQEEDTAAISAERRQRVANQIVNDVRTQYWAVLLGRQRLAEARAIVKDIESALELSGKLGKQNLQDPLIGLNYRDGLIELRRQIQQHETDLATAHAQLARLLNLHPRQKLELAPAAPDFSFRTVMQLDPDVIDDAALLSRTELREADHTLRSRRLDVIRAYVSMVPQLRLRAAAMHDSSNTLNFNDWSEAGVTLSLDLLNIVSNLMRAGQAQRGVALADLRRLAISMAVLEQVGIARARIASLAGDFALAQEATRVRREIYELRKRRLPFDVGDELERVRAAVAALAGQLREDKAYLSLQSAYGELLAAVGINQVPESLSFSDPKAAAEAVSQHTGNLTGQVHAAIARAQAALAAPAAPRAQ